MIRRWLDRLDRFYVPERLELVIGAVAYVVILVVCAFVGKAFFGSP